jgi:predicted dehydrogenase
MMRFGVCGTAFWAENVHIPGLKANPEIELVGVWGRTPERSTALAISAGIRPFASFDEMLDAVDAVSFVVPPSVQSELALRAVEQGRHVLLEKPIAAHLDEAGALVEAIGRKGVSGLCFLTRMFVPEVQAFIEQARSIAPGVGEASFRSDALLGGPYAGSAWRQAANGALWDAAPHGMSVLASVLGPIAEVSAKVSKDGTYTLQFNHARGGRSALDLNLRDASVKLAERYRFQNGRTAELPGLSYDRRETFTRASGILLRTVRGEGDAAGTRLALGLHMVAVASAAEASLRDGGYRRVSATPA